MLLQAVRQACSPNVWSKAVEIARGGNVVALAQKDGQVDLRVVDGPTSHAITLYPDDDEWSCDCDSSAEACVHVAAGAIAFNRGTLAAKMATVGYRLTSVGDALSFDRVLGDAPLVGSLAQQTVRFAATDADRTVEVFLGTRPRGTLTREHWGKLWPALSECEDVQVDGKRVRLGPPAATDALYIEEKLFARVAPREGLTRVWSNGPALDGDLLFLGQPSGVQSFAITDVSSFVTDVLPGLRERMPVVERVRLPELVDIAPSLHYDITPQGHGVSVLVTLVYGSSARIDNGRLHWLGGPLPRRRPREEQRLLASARVGERFFVDDAEAFLREQGRLRSVPMQAAMRDGKLTLDGIAPELLAHAARMRQPVVSLGDGTFTVVPEALLRLLNAKLEPAQQLDAARVLRELSIPPPPDLQPLLGLLGDALPAAELPADLTATLRDYQRSGVDWLVCMQRAGLGALLADDMGLGKTVQTISALGEGRTLIVAPTSVLGVWERELARFRPSLRVRRYHGPKRSLDGDFDVALTTYGTLRVDAVSVAWDTLVLDEAQAIKNADSQTARACFALKGKRRIALSGTPIENSLDELWSVFHFLNPGYLARDLPLAETRARVRPFILRRRKEQVARDLPPRTDNVLLCELSSAEREIYEAMHAATVPSVLAALDHDVLSALEALLRLRQAASHPALLPGHSDWQGSSSKLEALVASLESLHAEGHKALVFSQWTSFLDLVERALPFPFARLDGSTRDRAAVVSSFEAADGPPVMLISLKAGGTGLTLTAADYVFLLDPWWNPAVEEQAAARAHRIGQTKPVFVYRLIGKDTVEERLLALQAEKRALFDAVLGDEALAQRLTKADLLRLLAVNT